MNGCLVLKGDICYSKSPTDLFTQEGGFLVCEQGQSAGVFAELPERYRQYPVQDYGHAVILPGLVDLHVHAPQFVHRALGMDLELLDWLEAYTFPAEARYRDLRYAERAYPAFVEALRNGPNTRAVIFATCHVPATLRLMDMLEASGLRTLVGKVNMDRNTLPALQELSAEASLADTRAWLLEAQRRFRRTGAILTPRFLPSCSDALMRGLAQMQKETSLPLQSHLSENQSECAWVQELCPGAANYADAYRRLGLLDAGMKTVMAHCVWSGDEEIDLLAERGVYMAHCPQSNMNLSSGIAPVRRFMDRGVPVGLGSDVAGGCHLSIFRAMTDAVQASKLHWRLQNQEEAPLSLKEAFYLATVGGGSFFGRVGSFAAGYALDALVVDDTALAVPEPLSLEDRLARIAYLSDDRHIAAKYVAGEELFRRNVS